MNIIYDVMYGFWLAQLTQVNHVTEEVSLYAIITGLLINYNTTILCTHIRRLSGQCQIKTTWFMETGKSTIVILSRVIP